MTDLAHIKHNLIAMRNMGAPDEDLDAYVAEQGVDAKAIRDYEITPLDTLKYQTKTALQAAGQGISSGLNTAFVKTPAAIRARTRELGKTGDINAANQAADAAFKTPGTSPTFQDGRITEVNNALDKNPNVSKALDAGDQFITNTVKNVPEQLLPSLGKQSIQELTKDISPLRFAASLPASAAGMVEDIGTNPAELVAMAATDGAVSSVGKIPVKGLTLAERAEFMPIGKILASSEGQAGKAAKEAIKARDLFVKNVPLPGDVERKRAAGEAAVKYVSKSKDAEELANQMELAKGINAGEMRNRLSGEVLSEERSQHDPLLEYIREYADTTEGKTKTGQNNIKKLRELQTADVDTLNAQSPEVLNDPNFYQKQKRDLQGKAASLGAYRDDPSNAIMSEGYKKLAQGYRQKLENLGADIGPINAEESGLVDSFEGARTLTGNEITTADPSLAKEAAYAIAQEPKTGAVRLARKMISDRATGPNIPKVTGKIENLMNSSEKAQQLSDLIESIKARRVEPATVEPPLALPAPAPQQLTWDLTGKIKRGELLPDAQGSGPTIAAPGSSTINMGADAAYPQTGNLPAVQYPGLQPRRPGQIELPEVPDTVKAERLKQLIEQMGVSQYGDGPRLSIPASDIHQSPAAIEQPGLIFGNKRRKSIADLLKRRTQNLG